MLAFPNMASRLFLEQLKKTVCVEPALSQEQITEHLGHLREGLTGISYLRKCYPVSRIGIQ